MWIHSKFIRHGPCWWDGRWELALVLLCRQCLHKPTADFEFENTSTEFKASTHKRSPYSRCRNQHADQPQTHFKRISCQMWSLQKPKRARRLGVHAGMRLMVRLAQRRSQWRPSASMPCWPRVKGSRLLAREAKLGRSSLRAVTPAARVPGHAVIFLTKMCL